VRCTPAAAAAPAPPKEEEGRAPNKDCDFARLEKKKGVHQDGEEIEMLPIKTLFSCQNGQTSLLYSSRCRGRAVPAVCVYDLSSARLLALQFPVCCAVLVLALSAASRPLLCCGVPVFNCGHCLGGCFCSSLLCVGGEGFTTAQR
jgi:hypothetical protein